MTVSSFLLLLLLLLCLIRNRDSPLVMALKVNGTFFRSVNCIQFKAMNSVLWLWLLFLCILAYS